MHVAVDVEEEKVVLAEESGLVLAHKLREMESKTGKAYRTLNTRAYGTIARTILGDARSLTDLGTVFGGDLTEREVDWLVQTEWARTAQDVLWRRSKLGLRFAPEEVTALERRLAPAVSS